jgi:hypothetical protein
MTGLLLLLVVLTALQILLEFRERPRLSQQRLAEIEDFYAWLERTRIMQERRELWLRGERWY